MKGIKQFLTETLSDKFRNFIYKITHPFAKAHQLPYILLTNGNCWAPGESINEHLEDVDKMIWRCYNHILNKK